jgi:transcriptional regulator with XRE-family HTH domain
MQMLNRELGLRIKAARSNARLTQAQLADKSGVSRASIAIIERGRQSLPIHVVYRLCEALGIEVCDILPIHAEVAVRSVSSMVIPYTAISELPMTAEFVEQSKRLLGEGIPYGDER